MSARLTEATDRPIRFVNRDGSTIAGYGNLRFSRLRDASACVLDQNRNSDRRVGNRLRGPIQVDTTGCHRVVGADRVIGVYTLGTAFPVWLSDAEVSRNVESSVSGGCRKQIASTRTTWP